ncbi:MAG: hypothetical protein ACI4NG_01035 [Candidatus Gallimonas sp.]
MRIVRTALRSAAHLLAFCLKIVYNILKLLKVRLLALYLAACGFLQLCFRAFDGGKVYFFLGLCFFVGLSLFGWLRDLRERRRRSGAAGKKTEPSEPKGAAREKTRNSAPDELPRYYEAEGHPGYLFAEYGDRYELFVRSESGWTYLRTDYKQDQRSRK